MNAAEKFVADAASGGWSVAITVGGQVRVSQRFTPGDKLGFCRLDGTYWGLLSTVPVRSGSSSIWGTDGGGIGGAVAIQTGLFFGTVSGVQKRFLTALKRVL